MSRIKIFFVEKQIYTLPLALLMILCITAIIYLFRGVEHLQDSLFLLYGLPIFYAGLVVSLQTAIRLSVMAILLQIIARWDYFAPQINEGIWLGLILKGVVGVGLYLAFCNLLVNLLRKQTNISDKYKVIADELASTAKELKDANENINKLYLSTIQALAAAIDAKDPYTRGHSERVTKYAIAISRELDLEEDKVQEIMYASILHDIGKIGISEKILGKAGKLEPEEYQDIQKHPTIGANIISTISMLDSVIPIITHHHEFFNGGGYPYKKSKETIPLGSRIIAVADAYDAMTSTRPYRKALTKDEAVAELRRCSGSQFDPKVVEAFLRTL